MFFKILYRWDRGCVAARGGLCYVFELLLLPCSEPFCHTHSVTVSSRTALSLLFSAVGRNSVSCLVVPCGKNACWHTRAVHLYAFAQLMCPIALRYGTRCCTNTPLVFLPEYGIRSWIVNRSHEPSTCCSAPALFEPALKPAPLVWQHVAFPLRNENNEKLQFVGSRRWKRPQQHMYYELSHRSTPSRSKRRNHTRFSFGGGRSLRSKDKAQRSVLPLPDARAHINAGLTPALALTWTSFRSQSHAHDYINLILQSYHKSHRRRTWAEEYIYLVDRFSLVAYHKVQF